MNRDGIIALIRKGYDPEPKDWPRHRAWDDGAGDIAEKIIAAFQQHGVETNTTVETCPRCNLKAESLLHKFCVHSDCPIRSALIQSAAPGGGTESDGRLRPTVDDAVLAGKTSSRPSLPIASGQGVHPIGPSDTVDCPDCRGSGSRTISVAGCCENPTRTGECCGNAIEVPSYEECSSCGGSGMVPGPSDPSQEPVMLSSTTQEEISTYNAAQEPEAVAAVQWLHHDPIGGFPVWKEKQFWNGVKSSTSRNLYTRPVSLDLEAVKDELRAKIMDLPRITETRSGVVRSYVALDDVIGHMNGDAEGTPLSPPSNAEGEFRVIPGFEDYEITRSGSARRIKPLRCDTNERPLLNSRPAPTGYRRFFLRVDRKPRSLFVHRAVALAWIGVPSADKPCVAHLDGNRTNNHVDNLAWVSYAENERHKSIHGTHPVGAARAASKMKDEDVVIARRRFSTGEATIKDLADEYGIRMTTMSDLINGRTWTHLPVFPAPVLEPRP